MKSRTLHLTDWIMLGGWHLKVMLKPTRPRTYVHTAHMCTAPLGCCFPCEDLPKHQPPTPALPMPLS